MANTVTQPESMAIPVIVAASPLWVAVIPTVTVPVVLRQYGALRRG